MKTIVAKFGGSSLADAEHFRRVGAILKADPARRAELEKSCSGILRRILHSSISIALLAILNENQSDVLLAICWM